ncbi:MAG: ATP-binding protein, partial [Lachnospiraceae bacterium]|nr:ATP-binding protein [Lachnospiraceae bacterium]
MKILTIEAKTENLEQVLRFVEEQLECYACPQKVVIKIDIAVEELFVNIAHYAYRSNEGNVSICMDVTENPLTAVITFIDRGIPYNPLARKDPDVTLSAEDRKIGGLGIYMVK